MKIIVTGGAGFIASHITDAYIAAGHKVVVLDDLSTGFRRNLNPKAKFYKVDIRDRARVDEIFKKEKPEIVNHHAAIAEVLKSVRDPMPTLTVNILGTTNLLLALGAYGKGKNKKFIFPSTSAVYGDLKQIPAPETHPTVPLSPYGLSKRMGEDVIEFYARLFGFSYLIFRYPNVYGPRQNPHGEAGVVAIFTGLMQEGKQPTIFGDGSKSRDYAYVADIVRANVIGLKRGKNELMHLGWGKPVTDQMIFDAVAKHVGFSGKPNYAPYRKGEMYKAALLATRAQKILGWKPKISLDKGVHEVVLSLSRKKR